MNIFHEARSRLFYNSRQPQPFRAYMDDAEQQLIYEQQMASSSSTESSPTIAAAASPQMSAQTASQQPFAQTIPHNPMEALQS
jgi:hypothetical protein